MKTGMWFGTQHGKESFVSWLCFHFIFEFLTESVFQVCNSSHVKCRFVFLIRRPATLTTSMTWYKKQDCRLSIKLTGFGASPKQKTNKTYVLLLTAATISKSMSIFMAGNLYHPGWLPSLWMSALIISACCSEPMALRVKNQLTSQTERGYTARSIPNWKVCLGRQLVLFRVKLGTLSEWTSWSSWIPSRKSWLQYVICTSLQTRI